MEVRREGAPEFRAGDPPDAIGFATLTGRDALVYRLGEAMAAWHKAGGGYSTDEGIEAALADLRAFDATGEER